MKTADEIKQKAEDVYPHVPIIGTQTFDYTHSELRENQRRAFIKGAESMLSEVKRLEEENKTLKERLTTLPHRYIKIIQRLENQLQANSITPSNYLLEDVPITEDVISLLEEYKRQQAAHSPSNEGK